MTLPAIGQIQDNAAPHLIVTPYYKDPGTGELYVHKDLVRTQEPWVEENHIGPIQATESFGDVASWAAYVKKYAPPDLDIQVFLTWGPKGLHAVLDYHGVDRTGQRNRITAGRCKWKAVCPFDPSPEWVVWTTLAKNQAVSQRQAVELLEERAEDIKEPSPADLMNLLRNLRANVTARADTELRPDGTTKVAFSVDKSLKAAGEFDLPSQITITIPVIKGHTNAEGQPVLQALIVRLRATLDGEAHLALRFSLQSTGQVLDKVFSEQVARARTLLGEAYPIFRAAG